MAQGKVCLLTALSLAASFAATARAQLFANHSDNEATSHDASFYHADFNNDGIEDLAYINTPLTGTPLGTFDIEFADGPGGDVSDR
jgi:hypothetical protein